MGERTRADQFGDPDKQRVRWEQRGAVAVLTLSDEGLNGYTYRMFRDLDDCILRARFERAVQTGAGLPLEAGLALERELQAKLFASDDAREGLEAFVEKRKAEFSGS